MTIPPPRNALVSFHYYRNADLDALRPLNLIGDSGAYSARTQGVEIANDDLAGWITRWRHRLVWAASMDVAGNTKLTRFNWLNLVERGIPAVSSLHVGTDPREMDWYADRGVDFLGLGGVAGGALPPKVQLRWLVQVFKYARDNHPEMRFHGWGITRRDFLRLPFYSVDSSSWSSGYRYGRLNLRDPRSDKTHAIQLDGRTTYDPEVATLLRDHYGVNPSEIATSGPHNRLLVVRLSALSASVHEQRFRRMHRNPPITAPSWGRLGGVAVPEQVGPHAHLAITSPTKDKVVPSMHGPNLHLAEGHLEHLEEVARLYRT